MEIPIFEAVNPRWWVRKCERVFEWNNVPMRQRVTLATTYFNEVVDAWFQGCVSVQNEFTWEEVVTKLCESFGEKNRWTPLRSSTS